MPRRLPLRWRVLRALRRFLLLRPTLGGLGVEPGRIKLIWASAAEGLKLAHEISQFVEEVRALGPLSWPKWNDQPAEAEAVKEAA